ncbi:MAG: hypothetical protein V5A76_08385 [Candidatus Thermoplasmatota archaeon]
MPTSIERIRELTKTMRSSKKEDEEKEDFAEKWLGSFEDSVSSSKTSTEIIKELRSTSYGKIKK